MAKRQITPQAKQLADLSGLMVAALALFVILRAAGIFDVSVDWLWGYGIGVLTVFLAYVRVQVATTPKGD